MTDSDWYQPVNHTGVISSTRDALEKLWWNFGIFEHQRSARDGGQGQGFAIIDYALASGAVHAWFCAEYKNGVATGRVEPLLGWPEKVSAVLQERVSFWSQFQAIGNAIKHRNVSADYWRGGVNMPVLQPDDASQYVWEHDESDPSLTLASLMRQIADGSVWYENTFYTPGSKERVFARDALLRNYESWHALVHEVGPDF